jgi:hypothetical protein
MRMLNKGIAGAAVAAMLTLAAGFALADPPAGVTPSASSVVGVGSNTTEYLLDQFAADYDHAHPHGTQIYSFDACQGSTCTSAPPVVTKKGCRAVTRVSIDGSSYGITALEANVADGKGLFCIDFARSSRYPETTDPTGITFVALALDGVTYASLAKGSNVPGNLTTAQLHAIYTCSVTRKGYRPNTWGALLGTKAKKGTRNIAFAPYLPSSYEGYSSSYIGVTVSGPAKCVTQPPTLEENEGIDPIFKGKTAPNILVPFSVGKWIAQAYHSPSCAAAGCPTMKTQSVFVQCKTPSRGQNKFGCDVNGPLGLNDVNGVSPTTGKGTKTVVNVKFPYFQSLYDVVRGTDAIPSYLQKFFGIKGAFCSKPYQSVIRAYGFRADPACGSLTAG